MADSEACKRHHEWLMYLQHLRQHARSHVLSRSASLSQILFNSEIQKALWCVFCIFFSLSLSKRSSIWWDLKGAALHKQPSRVFRGFWNINKRACRYIILLQQLWQQRENVSELCYKSHNTATPPNQAWLVPQANLTVKPHLYRWLQERLSACVLMCVCVCVCA